MKTSQEDNNNSSTMNTNMRKDYTHASDDSDDSDSDTDTSQYGNLGVRMECDFDDDEDDDEDAVIDIDFLHEAYHGILASEARGLVLQQSQSQPQERNVTTHNHQATHTPSSCIKRKNDNGCDEEASGFASPFPFGCGHNHGAKRVHPNAIQDQAQASLPLHPSQGTIQPASVSLSSTPCHPME
jgi:hypothetical protein